MAGDQKRAEPPFLAAPRPKGGVAASNVMYPHSAPFDRTKTKRNCVKLGHASVEAFFCHLSLSLLFCVEDQCRPKQNPRRNLISLLLIFFVRIFFYLSSYVYRSDGWL